jgi:hypothetical protein
MRLPLSFLASLFWSPHPRPHRRPVEAPVSAVFDDDVTDCARTGSLGRQGSPPPSSDPRRSRARCASYRVDIEGGIGAEVRR